MKVLQINNFHYFRGGADKVYLETGRLLEEKGHTVRYFASNHPDNIISSDAKYFPPYNDLNTTSLAKVVPAVARFLYSTKSKYYLTSLLEKFVPDIVHVHIFQSQLSNSILTALTKIDVPIVMTLHEYKLLCPVYNFLDSNGNLCEECASGSKWPCIKKRCKDGNLGKSIVLATESQFRTIAFPLERYIDRFLAVSQFVVDKHLQHMPWLEPKLYKLSNFVDESRFVGQSVQRGNYDLYVGRLSKEKGLHNMIQCYRESSQKLLIVGDGPMNQELQQLVTEDEGVSFLGKKGELEVANLMAHARYLILPSETYETFGPVSYTHLTLPTICSV